MLGPYDSKPSSGRVILMGYKRKLMFYPPGGKNFVAVQDVAGCAVSALTTGVPGTAYIIGGENMYHKDIFRMLSGRTGTKCLMLKIPD